MLSNKQTIGVLRASHEITLNGHLSLVAGQPLGNESYKLRLRSTTLLQGSRAAQDANNKFFKDLRLYREFYQNVQIKFNELEKQSTGVLVRICTRYSV